MFSKFFTVLISAVLFIVLPPNSYTQSIIKTIAITSNAGEPLTETIGFDVTEPPTYPAYTADYYRDVALSPNTPPTILLPDNTQQISGAKYFVVARGRISFEAAVDRWTRNGANNQRIEGNSYEIRFTPDVGKGLMAFSTGNVVDVPFELWYLGADPNDLSDDVRMIPFLLDVDLNDVFNLGPDDGVDDGENDPSSDYIYFRMPIDISPGEAGYNNAFPAGGGFDLAQVGPEHLARVVLMSLDHDPGNGPAMPETGTTFRIICGDIPPTCTLTSVDAGPPVSFQMIAQDGIGLASIEVSGATNATVNIPTFTPGVSTVDITITQTTPNMVFGVELEVLDVGGNFTQCVQEFNLPIHNVGNIALALQTNSLLGLWPTLPATGVDAFWPRPGGMDHLFTGGLWVGAEINGEKIVMANMFNTSEWAQTAGTPVTITADISDQDIGMTYDDQSAPSIRIGLQVDQQSFQWSDPARDDFIIFTYTLENTGLNEDLTDVYTALRLDPDIGNFSTDKAGFDDGRGLIYQFDEFGFGGHIGLMVLGDSPHSKAGQCNGCPPNPVNDEGKFDLMVTPPPINSFASDYRIMITAKPFDLDVGESHTVAFGLVFGDGLSGLQANADVMAETFLGAFVGPILKIQELIDEVEVLINEGTLNNGQGNALITRLEGAILKLNQGKTTPAINKLNAFINQVNAFINSGVLTETEGQELISAANDIIDLINNSLGKKGNEGASPELVSSLPTEFKLNQNYPNPFNPSTNIKYSVPETGVVKLAIYNTLGEEVAVLVDGMIETGFYEVAFNASNLPSGIYFYRLQAGNKVQTKKMILMK